MAGAVLLPAAEGLLADVWQLLGGVWAGGGLGGDPVPVDVSAARPESLLPLAVATVVSFFYLQAIEAAGAVVATALGVGSALDPKRRSAKRERFCTAWGEAVYFTVQVVVSYRLFGGTSWYWPSGWDTLTAENLEGDPSPPVYRCAREMRTYYVIEFGWYSMGLAMLFLKKRRSDFLEMLSHHAITSTLIFTSYTYGYIRVGIVVMTLHNLFDPFLNIAKCCHYALKGPLHVIADINFGMASVVFLISRLLMYPVVVYNVWFHNIMYPGKVPVWDATVDQWICKICLVMLYPIHLFWCYLLLKTAKKALRGGTVQKDERSDSEDGEEPDHSTGKQAVKDCDSSKRKNE
ncbi:unnamed protein product [Prorocentrum cordatum]|uniref:TLC domain-containing protein n=1 Tax=Prorocentrum cordatum TaxID=2364126 RepID=A0ABN9SY08_9DINO|nr:unnamed protein product [Polarella glacialis]